jgi:immune inhibitor A
MGRAAGPATDKLPNPLGAQQASARSDALTRVLQGKATPQGPQQVVASTRHGRDAGNTVRYKGANQFVQLAQTGEGKILTILGQFGSGVANNGTPGSPAGPLHNQIPKPDRTVDNTSIWAPDFSQAYYQNQLFSRTPGANSMANFFLEQSSGRYSVSGNVTPWVTVPNNESSYGSDYCGSIVCADTWFFIQDEANAFASTFSSTAALNAYLSQFDVYDRYDYNGNGNFNEPDGYIDHFQGVHGGLGEEVGGGAQGSDAIWSHSWYVQLTPIGSGGPAGAPFGGTRIGNSNYWIGDYTVQPEDGGVGVFAHEYSHDIGLPDAYDTAGGENSTAWWTLMSQGSYGTGNKVDLGSKPIGYTAWEKLQLGWLDYDLESAGDSAKVRLGPSISQTKGGKQAMIVLLPDKEVATHIANPYAGGKFYYSSSGNNLDNRMTRSVTLPAGSPTLSAKVQYDIEQDYDYAYVTVNGTAVATNLSSATNPNGQNFGQGITGSSGGNWVDLTADLTAFAGQTVAIGFRYWTDSGVSPPGFMADQIQIGSDGPFGAEASGEFTFAPPTGGFRATSGNETSFNFNAYIAEYRQYNGYDEGLKTSPYNFGFLDNPSLQNWVEHFPYEAGLLITYWDETFADNNTSTHPGGGLFLPIDAHPKARIRLDGVPWRARVQSVDSTFGTQWTHPLTLHRNSVAQHFGPLKPVTTFDDSKSYWDAVQPLASVITPNTGTKIRAGETGDFYMWVYLNR